MNHTIEHTGDSVLHRWVASAAVAVALMVLALAAPTPALASIPASDHIAATR